VGWSISHPYRGTRWTFAVLCPSATIEDVETVIDDPEVKQAVYEGNARRVLRVGAGATA
jgi:hypothetical protein